MVAIDAGGAIVGPGGPLTGRRADAWWAEQARTRREGLRTRSAAAAGELPTLVVVRADKEASYGAVRKALAAAQEKGFAHFTLVVLREKRP